MNAIPHQPRAAAAIAAPLTAGVVLALLLAADERLIAAHTRVNWPWWCNALESYGSAWGEYILAFTALIAALIINRAALRQLIFALPLQSIIGQSIKWMVGRVRPVHGADALLFDAFSMHRSFPSGHAALAWTIAFVFIMRRSRTAPAWVLIALFVCWARLQTYAHFPSDLFAGAMVGYVAAAVTDTLFNSWITTGRWGAAPQRQRTTGLSAALCMVALIIPIGVASLLGRRVQPVTEAHAQVEVMQLYRDILAREPDAPGLSAYVQQRIEGRPLIGIERDILDSDESRRRLRAMDPAERLAWLYQLLRRREPTTVEASRDLPLVADLSRGRGRLGLLVMRLTWRP